MSAAQVLREAADYIEKYGWCQRRYEDARGCCCTLGALAKVVSGNSNPLVLSVFNGDFATYTEAKIALSPGVGWMPIDVWNDSPDQTAENVISTMRSVADELDA